MSLKISTFIFFISFVFSQEIGREFPLKNLKRLSSNEEKSSTGKVDVNTVRVFLHPSLYSIDSFLVEERKVLKLEGFEKTRMQPKNSGKPMFILSNANLHAKNTVFEFLPNTSHLVRCDGDKTSRIKGVLISQGINSSMVSGIAFLVMRGSLRLDDVVVSNINFDHLTASENGIVVNRAAVGSINIANSVFSEIDFGNGNGNSVVNIQQSPNPFSNDNLLRVNINFAKFNNCKGSHGGAVHVNANGEVLVNITGSQFTNNLASENGGAVYLNATSDGDNDNKITAEIDRSIFLNNKANDNVPNNIHVEENVELIIHQSVSNHADGLFNYRNLLNAPTHFVFVTKPSHFDVYAQKHKGDQRNPYTSLKLQAYPEDTLSKSTDVFGILIGGGIFPVEEQLVPPADSKVFIVYGDSNDTIRGDTIVNGELEDKYFVYVNSETTDNGAIELSSFTFNVLKSGLLSLSTTGIATANLANIFVSSVNSEQPKSEFQNAIVYVNGDGITLNVQNTVISKTTYASSLFVLLSQKIYFTNVNISGVESEGEGEILKAAGSVNLNKVSIKSSKGFSSDGVYLYNGVGSISNSTFQGVTSPTQKFDFASSQGYLVVLSNTNVTIETSRFTSASVGAVYVGEGVNVDLVDSAALYNYKLSDGVYDYPGLRLNVLCGGGGEKSNVTLKGSFLYDTPKGGDETLPWINHGHRCNVKVEDTTEKFGVTVGEEGGTEKAYFPQPSNLAGNVTEVASTETTGEKIVIDADGDNLYPIQFGYRFVTKKENQITTEEGIALLKILNDVASTPEGRESLARAEKQQRANRAVLSSISSRLARGTASNTHSRRGRMANSGGDDLEEPYGSLAAGLLIDEHHVHLEFLRSGFPKGVELYLQLSNDGKYYSTVPHLSILIPDNKRAKSNTKNCCWWIVFPIVAAVATIAAIIAVIYIKRRKKPEVEAEPEIDFNMEYDTNYDFGKSKLEKNEDQNFDAFMQSFNQSASKISLEGVKQDENGEIVDISAGPEIDPFGDGFATGDGKVGIMMDEDGNIIDTTLNDGDMNANTAGLDLADDIPIQLIGNDGGKKKKKSKSNNKPNSAGSGNRSNEENSSNGSPGSAQGGSRKGKSSSSGLRPMSRPVPTPEEPRRRYGGGSATPSSKNSDRMLDTATGGYDFLASSQGALRDMLATASSGSDKVPGSQANMEGSYEPVDVGEISYDANPFGEVPVLDAEDS